VLENCYGAFEASISGRRFMPSFPKEIGSTTEDPRIIGSWARLSKPQTKSAELVALRAFPHSSAAVVDAVVVVPVLVADLRRGAVTMSQAKSGE
jgi:hypothetical protein